MSWDPFDCDIDVGVLIENGEEVGAEGVSFSLIGDAESIANGYNGASVVGVYENVPDFVELVGGM